MVLASIVIVSMLAALGVVVVGRAVARFARQFLIGLVISANLRSK